LVQAPKGAFQGSKKTDSSWIVSYDINTSEGDSGNPLWSVQQREIIGIHHSHNLVTGKNEGTVLIPLFRELARKMKVPIPQDDGKKPESEGHMSAQFNYFDDDDVSYADYYLEDAEATFEDYEDEAISFEDQFYNSQHRRNGDDPDDRIAFDGIRTRGHGRPSGILLDDTLEDEQQGDYMVVDDGRVSYGFNTTVLERENLRRFLSVNNLNRDSIVGLPDFLRFIQAPGLTPQQMDDRYDAVADFAEQARQQGTWVDNNNVGSSHTMEAAKYPFMSSVHIPVQEDWAALNMKGSLLQFHDNYKRDQRETENTINRLATMIVTLTQKVEDLAALSLKEQTGLKEQALPK